MGEVYRATDTRLGRTVAIKVLGAALSDRVESRERFEREARTISNLNHPHICTLYDVGHQDSVDYLVMEYIEGETLAAVLERGPIPFENALTISIQIGDALDKAHRQGVVHRDLKPANVMLAKNGAKLLDFGLAKLRAPEAPVVAVSATALPTDARNLTGAGTILGTLQYMSPEQLEGKEADARSDVFAFGATLYEMLTGRKAFQGKTQVSLMASILEHEPPALSSIQPVVPEALESVVHGCLAKDPDERWQTARDVVRQLKWLRSHPANSPTANTGIQESRSKKVAMAGLIAALLLIIAAAGVYTFYLREGPSLPLVRFYVMEPEDGTFTGDPPRFSVSPDGRYVVFAASGNGQRDQLWLRRLDSTEAKPIVGSEQRPGEVAPQWPFWSPDSKSVAFFVQTQAVNAVTGLSRLKKVDIQGGPVQTLA
jgi:serine/threonine protein kinase